VSYVPMPYTGAAAAWPWFPIVAFSLLGALIVALYASDQQTTRDRAVCLAKACPVGQSPDFDTRRSQSGWCLCVTRPK
jgi:hypothetical protein